MSLERVMLDISPLIDYYDAFIDNKLGILGSVALKEEMIVTEVMLLMGMEMHPSNNSLRVMLSENVVTDVKDKLLNGFNNIAYGLLASIENYLQYEHGSITVRPAGCYYLEIVLHKAMSPQQIHDLMRNHGVQL